MVMEAGFGIRSGRERSAPEPLIAMDESACRECWNCVRSCPARAIRVIAGVREIIPERCVGCGRCIVECGHGGVGVRDDLGRVRELLASGRPVVAMLASEHAVALQPRSVGEVTVALEAAGFFAVETVLLGEEIVAVEYEARHATGNGAPVVRSTCPVTNEWLLRFHPALASALAPIVPPYIAQARLIRQVYPRGTAVVYVSPCFARKDEALDPQFEGAVDVAIDFLELATLLDEPAEAPVASPCPARAEPAKEISLTDGYPRSTFTQRDMTSLDVSVVRGLAAFDRVLTAMEAGEAAPRIVDALCCHGCLDGPAVGGGLSLFAKRNLEASRREGIPRAAVGSRDLVRNLPAVDLRRSFAPKPVRSSVPTEAELDAILAAGGIADRASAIDCGACGFSTCLEHAEAICRGDSTWEMCFPLQKRRLEQDISQLEASSTLDPLTQVANRRAFTDRLHDEVARHHRYGTPVSLLMIDVDRFKQINDRHGHIAGDTVLTAVADVLRATLRETDIPARYGGDEFAVVLPGTTKTDAFAVAEKLRSELSRASISVGRDDTTAIAEVRVSVGVASAGRSTADHLELIEAADRALYHAKENGRNQVRLAPG